MTRTSFQTRVRLVIREYLGEDPFQGGIPDAPPDWVRQGMNDPTNAERNWTIFRDRFNGVSLHELAECYGMRPARVYDVVHQVLFTLITAPRQVTVRPNEPPPSTLARDCLVVNEQLAGRPGIARLDAQRLARVGIDPSTSLRKVPDEQLLRVGRLGPRTVAEIRRHFPFEPE